MTLDNLMTYFLIYSDDLCSTFFNAFLKIQIVLEEIEAVTNLVIHWKL